MTTLDWQPDGPDVLAIRTDEGRQVARYSYSAAKNHPYFWDVRPVNHGGVLTTHAPWDHRWHHGLWWSWKFVNDVLYWEDSEAYGGARAGLGRSHVVGHAVEETGPGPAIVEDLEWRVDATGQVVLREERRLTLRANLAADDAWAIDWDLRWTAVEDAHFSTTPYPENWWGGYAGLNYRAARSMRTGETILASGGLSGREAVHARPGAWSAYAGNVDGSGTDDPDHPAFGGVAILVHPQNWGTPTPVYTFSATDDFGFLAAAPLMHQDLTLAEGEQVHLRFRTVVLGSALDAAQLDVLHDQYSSASPPAA